MAGLKDNERALCRLAGIAKGGTRGFPGIEGIEAPAGLFVIRRGDEVFAYINDCPHLGTPLNWQPDVFLTRDGAYIQCSTHGAMFGIADGACISGPCYGESLRPVPVRVVDGTVVVTVG